MSAGQPQLRRILGVYLLAHLLGSVQSFTLTQFTTKTSVVPRSTTTDNQNNQQESSVIASDDKGDDIPPIQIKRRRKRKTDYPSSYCESKDDKRVKSPPSANTPDTNDKVSSALGILFFGGFESGLGDSIASATLKSRLVVNRAYAKKEPFEKDNINVPPNLSDLSYPISNIWKGLYVGVPSRLITCAIAYLIFPYITDFLDNFVSMSPEEMNELNNQFGPGISILYGTFISLTLSILYTRIKEIQETAANEAALLTLITRNLLSICINDRESAIEAAQCCADQVRTMVRSSRGKELLMLMYNDPYARMLELLDRKEEHFFEEYNQNSFGPKQIVLEKVRDTIVDTIKLRSQRLSREALSLPPTHFLGLNILSLLILLSFSVSVLPNLDPLTGAPPVESSVMFALLTSVYFLFYCFAQDLNNPFEGVYQIRRSSTATNLLEAKWFIVNHPLIQGEVSFEEAVNEEEVNGTSIESPDMSGMYFEEADLFVDDIAANNNNNNNPENQ